MPAAAKVVSDMACALPVPELVQKRFFDGLLSTATKTLLRPSLLDDTGIVGQFRQRQVQHTLSSSESRLDLLFPRQELGFIYGQPNAGLGSDLASSSSEYHPRIVAGGRLPHVQLKFFDGHGSTETISSHDLVAGTLKLCLIALAGTGKMSTQCAVIDHSVLAAHYLCRLGGGGGYDHGFQPAGHTSFVKERYNDRPRH